MRWTTRFAEDFRAARALRRAGVTLPSLVLYPLRRRLRRENRLALEDGTVLRSPAGEPLLTLFREVWLHHRYAEPSFSAALGHAIVDIGANVGVFTVWAARHSPQATVVAVEPAANACAVLRRNVQLNRLANVRVLEAACASQGGPRRLYRRGVSALSSLYDRDFFSSEFRADGEVFTLTLDQLFEQEKIGACDLLKLDCEGAEYEILLHASGAVFTRVARIALEYHLGLNAHQPGELVQLLQAHGFEVRCEAPLDQEGGYLYASRPRGGVLMQSGTKYGAGAQQDR